jgi:acyl carrier protein
MAAQLTPQTIVADLCRFARANLLAEGRHLDEHSPLTEVGIDSFALVELLFYSERAFDVRVPESHWTQENLRTLASLGHCIAELAGGKTRPSASL